MNMVQKEKIVVAIARRLDKKKRVVATERRLDRRTGGGEKGKRCKGT